MLKSKILFSVLLALPLILIIIFINLNLPTDAQAKPLAGFTPTPTPSSGGGGGGGETDSNNDDDDDSTSPIEDEPKDYIWVQSDRCNLHCGAGSANTDDQPDFQSLASVGTADVTNPLLIPLAKPQALPELLIPVRLVHDGSAFIVEGELSDVKPTRFTVPYPGHWQIWMTDSPRFMTAQAVDVTGSNLANLQIQLANGPVSLGLVEANTAEPQLVKCPMACILEEPLITEAPLQLPETGGQPETEMHLSTFLIIGILSIGVIGLTLRAVFRYSAGDRHL